jgi:hypothetical protein
MTSDGNFGLWPQNGNANTLPAFVTAEMAILNKSAIALAADSAVTILVGSGQKNL